MDKKAEQEKEKGTYPSMESHEEPPPAYQPFPTPSRPTRPAPPQVRANINSLPPHLLHWIFQLTLDPRATPIRFAGDDEEERVRRLWALFLGPRCVNRRFNHVSSIILHNHFLRDYHAHLPPGSSSSISRSPIPINVPCTPAGVVRSIQPRSREKALFNRFIAIYLGLILRQTESSLSEPTEDLNDLIRRLHPAARIEDLLLTFPASLIVPRGSPRAAFPLPQDHLYVNVSPGWVTLLLRTVPFGSSTTGRSVRSMTVVEVRRTPRLEDTVRRLQGDLEDIRDGIITWGGRPF